MNQNQTNIEPLLPVEIWEKIFHSLRDLVFSQKDIDIQRKAFFVTNGTNRYLRNCTKSIRRDYLLKLPTTSIDSASGKGNIDLLRWWVEESEIPRTRLSSYYTSSAIHDAAANDLVNVLDWWKSSELPLKYGSEVLEIVTQKGNTKVLDWWKRNRMPFRFRKSPMDVAQRVGRWDMVKWWLMESEQPMAFTFPVQLLRAHIQV